MAWHTQDKCSTTKPHPWAKEWYWSEFPEPRSTLFAHLFPLICFCLHSYLRTWNVSRSSTSQTFLHSFFHTSFRKVSFWCRCLFTHASPGIWLNTEITMNFLKTKKVGGDDYVRQILQREDSDRLKLTKLFRKKMMGYMGLKLLSSLGSPCSVVRLYMKYFSNVPVSSFWKHWPPFPNYPCFVFLFSITSTWIPNPDQPYAALFTYPLDLNASGLLIFYSWYHAGSPCVRAE